MRQSATTALLFALGAAASAQAAFVVNSNFDQVAMINTLGGTVHQIGGTGAGNQMFTAGDYTGPFGPTTGVLVNMPGWDFVDSAGVMIDPPPTEASNIPSLHLIGAPLDITFTQPGPGGPDGTDGDSSIFFSAGDSVSVFWNSVQNGLPGVGADLFIFTDPNSGGQANFTFRLGGVDVDTLLNVTVPGGPLATGFGGMLVNTLAAFDEIFIEGVSGNVEIDAIGSVPAPGFLGLGFAGGLLAAHRRR